MENENQITQETPETTDGFLDGWEEPVSDGADQPAEIAEEAPAREPDTAAAGQGTGTEPAPDAADHAAEGAAEQPGAQQPPADAPRVWDLRYMDQVRQVGEAEMVTLAQKGLDYDRIRGRYDESKPVMALFGQFARQAGMSVPDYVAHIRTQAKQAGGMSEAEARRAVELEDREAVVAQREAAEAQRQSAATARQAAQQSAEARRQNVSARHERAGKEHISMWTGQTALARREADILEFQRRFPAAARDPSAIPPQVWAQVRSGSTLTEAYGAYLRDRGQGDMNAARSTGSLRSAGGEFQHRDPFLLGWDSE